MSCHPPTIHLPRQPAQEILKDEDNVNDCIVLLKGKSLNFAALISATDQRPSGRQPCHCSSSVLAPVLSPTSSTRSTTSKEGASTKELVTVTKWSVKTYSLSYSTGFLFYYFMLMLVSTLHCILVAVTTLPIWNLDSGLCQSNLQTNTYLLYTCM